MGLVRVALALAVLLSHLPPAKVHFIGGGLAVQAFFIISGFYMALVLSGKYNTVGLFYTNRLLRLMPSYFVMLVIATVALLAFDASAVVSRDMIVTAYSRPEYAGLLIFENLGVVGQELLYWFKLQPDGTMLLDLLNRPETDQEGAGFRAMMLPQAWSLAMELVFYAIAPFLVRARTRTLVVLAAASIALRFAGYLLPVDYGLWQGRFFPTSLFFFAFGILAYRALPMAARVPKIFGWLVNAALLATIVLLPEAGLSNELTRWVVYAAVAVAMPFVFHAFKSIAFDRWIGDLSYPIYLTHLAVIGVVLTYELPMPVWLTLGATLALSAALLVFIEHPIDRWRQRRAERFRSAGPRLTPANV